MEFVGRERELALLEKRLTEIRSTGRGALIAMRGRRRVGKSRLVEEFAHSSGSPYVFYTAVQEPGAQELRRFVDAVAQSDAPRAEAIRSGLRPETWEAALNLVAEETSRPRPLIIVLDELPYLAEKEPSIEAVLQKVWDRTFQRSPALVILIGSDEAMMTALTEQGRPLYDRAREMVIHPLTPAEIAEMLALSATDALDAYLVIGGFPVLALEWGTGREMIDYLSAALDDPTSFLVVSGERALAAEFPTDTQARQVLAAIGAGSRAHKDIGAETGIHATGLDRALTALQKKLVVRRLKPYSTRAASKTVRWEITDPYLRFWLRFINKRVDLIERGRGAILLEQFERSWASFRGRAIEHVVRDSLGRLLPDEERFGAARYVGGYWNRTSTVEVDLIGGDRVPVAKRLGFIGSIKWRVESPFGRDDVLDLASRRDDIPGAGSRTRLVGVSSQGFDDADALDVSLDPEDLLAAWRRPYP